MLGHPSAPKNGVSNKAAAAVNVPQFTKVLYHGNTVHHHIQNKGVDLHRRKSFMT